MRISDWSSDVCSSDLRNHLAGKEMAIGRWYLNRGQPLAAINRFQRVVDEYDTTAQVPEALLRMTEAYVSLGRKEEAERPAAVLRSEERRVGKEWVSTGRSRWPPDK